MIIYKTTNLINGKIYIGKACGIRVSNGYLGSGKYLKAAIKKYGKDNFIRVTIDIAATHEELCMKEKFWITFYNSRDRLVGYNLLVGGLGCGVGTDNPMHGRHHSEETKRKIAKCGKNHWLYGKTHSEETKQKIRIANAKGLSGMLNRKHSEETKRKISASMLGNKNRRRGE